MHYDDGSNREHVKAVFDKLEQTYGEVFSLAAHRGQSRARHVIELLGWHTFDAYVRDAEIFQLVCAVR